mgnify:CR=1 FL=1
MAVDIRAIVSTSLGEPISGSVNDEYVQGTGLIKCTGSVVIKGIITPAIGTAITISYTKSGGTKQLPRKLRVLSSFADPFRRTTSVELGCKLTYLSDKRDAIDWTAFDDTENTLTQADAQIITLPIRAQAVAAKCMAELGISGTFTLTNKFSIAKFDLSPGYVQVLSDLLVSESLCGYLDKNETLQVFSLNEEGGTGPVVDAASLVDIGKIGVGQLPGEAVTVSYSSLKLKRDVDQAGGSGSTTKPGWDRSETSSTYELLISYGGQDGSPKSAIYNVIDSNITTTDYFVLRTSEGESLRLPSVRTTVETTGTARLLSSVYSAYLSAGFKVSNVPVTKRTVETFEYDERGNEVLSEKTVYGGFEQFVGTANVNIVFSPTDYVTFPLGGTYTLEREVRRTIHSLNSQQVTTDTFGSWYQTIAGQQAIAAGAGNLTTSTEVSNYLNFMADTSGKCLISTQVSINSSSKPASAPSLADVNNASNAKGGSPSNGYRTESKASLELALGSATAQRRIELSLPYAPDDTFYKLGTIYGSIPSDAPQKAQLYGRVQNRLFMGNRNGMNLQLPPELMPEAPFSPFALQANGVTGLYRTNGTSWTFDAQGMVVATDALFWGGVGGSGIRWFPVAPGITDLPTTPPLNEDGTITVPGVVPVANETINLVATLRLRPVIEGIGYALEVVNEVVIPTRFRASVSVIQLVNVPAAGVTLAALVPSISTGAAAMVPSAAVTVEALAPVVSSGASVLVSAAAVTVAGVAPDMAGRQKTQILVPAVAVAVAVTSPAVASGASVAVPAGGITVAGVAPIAQATSNPISSLSPVLWYDFGDANTVTLSGSTITAINDKGSRSWNLAKSSTGPTQATWTNNSRKCCDWGSSAHSNYLQNTSSTSTNIAEMYIVLDAAFGSTFPDFNGLVSGTGAFAFTLCGYGATTRFYSDSSTFNSGYINGSTSDTYSTSILPGINSPCLLRIKKSTDAALTTTTGFQIGMDRNNSGRGWLGLVAEVVCFSSVLSSSDRVNVQNWLASKWGLTLV